MAIEKFADTPNQGITFLDGPLSDSATTIPVDSMADLKLTGLTGTAFAYVKITKKANWRQHPINRKESFEIVKVTAVSGNDLTATRGADGTSGTEFDTGDIVEVAFVSIHYQDLVDAITDGLKELYVGKIGAGIVPTEVLHGGATNAVPRAVLERTDSSIAEGNVIATYEARGGEASHTVVGQFEFEADEAWSPNTASGTRLIIKLAPSGSQTAAEVIRIAMNGLMTLVDGLDVGADVVMRGDTYWIGDGTGIPFGFMYVDGAQTIIVALTLNTPAEVKDDGTTSADDGWLAGDLNLFTMAAADLHYFSPNLAGKYEIVWDLSFNMASPGANVEIHGGIAIDGTPITDKGAAHRTIANNTDTGNMCGLAILDLAADAEISLWLENTTNNADVTVHHGNVTAKMAGG